MVFDSRLQEMRSEVWVKQLPICHLRHRGKKLATQGCTNPMGRPGKLTHDRTTALKSYFDEVRAEGACVDRECIAIWPRIWWQPSRKSQQPTRKEQQPSQN